MTVALAPTPAPAAFSSDKAMRKMQKNEALVTQMALAVSSFLPRWRDVAEHFNPILPEYLDSPDQSRGTEKTQTILDASPGRDLESCKAGILSGIMPAGQPWLRYFLKNPAKRDLTNVKVFMEHASSVVLEVLGASNLYTEAPGDIETLVLFGTSSMHMEEDYVDGMRFETQPIGSFMVLRNSRGMVDTWCRKFTLSMSRLVDTYGWDNDEDRGDEAKIDWTRFSESVKQAWDNGERTKLVEVVWVIRPNLEGYDYSKIEAKHMAYSSCHYEAANCYDGQGRPRYLRESGFNDFPMPTVFWQITTQDDYGVNCPGFKALPEVKELYITKIQRARALAKMGNPPTTGPSGLDPDDIDLTEGGFTPDDSTKNSGTAGLRAVYQINPAIERYNETILDQREQVSGCFFTDLFRMLIDDDRKQPSTAFEIQAKIQQNIRILAPILNSFSKGRLKPIAEKAFKVCLAQGRFGDIPEELIGETIEVEFTGVLMQALKIAGLAPLNTFLSIVSPVVAMDPSAMDALDTVEILQQAKEMTGVSSKIVRDDQMVAAIRAEKLKQAEAEKVKEALPVVADAAKTLSETELGGDNALAKLMGQA